MFCVTWSHLESGSANSWRMAPLPPSGLRLGQAGPGAISLSGKCIPWVLDSLSTGPSPEDLGVAFLSWNSVSFSPTRRQEEGREEGAQGRSSHLSKFLKGASNLVRTVRPVSSSVLRGMASRTLDAEAFLCSGSLLDLTSHGSLEDSPRLLREASDGAPASFLALTLGICGLGFF